MGTQKILVTGGAGFIGTNPGRGDCNDARSAYIPEDIEFACCKLNHSGYST